MSKILKLCPRCGCELVKRTNRENGSEFLGCCQWPDCTHTEGIPEYIRLIEQGAMQLPGFEAQDEY